MRIYTGEIKMKIQFNIQNTKIHSAYHSFKGLTPKTIEDNQGVQRYIMLKYHTVNIDIFEHIYISAKLLNVWA